MENEIMIMIKWTQSGFSNNHEKQKELNETYKEDITEFKLKRRKD